MNRIDNNYISKLNLRETQEALFMIETSLIKNLKENINFLLLRSPTYSIKKISSNNLSTKGQRQINFDSSIDSEIYYLYSDYANWLSDSLVKMKIKNNNGIAIISSYIERDEEIKNTNAMEKRVLNIEYRFDSEKLTFKKINNLYDIVFKSILKIESEIVNYFPKIKNYLPKELNKIKINDFHTEKDYKDKLSQIGISEGNFTLIKKMDSSINFNLHNYEISMMSFSKEIFQSFPIFTISDKKIIKDLEPDTLTSEMVKIEYNFKKENMADPNLRSINISINIDALSMILLNKSHILEIQSNKNIDEIEKLLKDAEIKHL